MNIEDLRLEASVVSSDGHKLGKLSRFVFERDSLKLTHIVVDTGILRSGEALWKGGWGLSHDRLVPLGCVSRADSDEIRITMSGDEFRDLSVDFSEEYFTTIPDNEPGRPDASDVVRLATSIPGEPGPYLMQQTTAVHATEADIRADSPVWRLDPHEKIGEVERVLFDGDTGRMAALVIRRGFVFTKDVVLPADHIVEVVAEIVRVQIDDAALKQLDEFHADD
jgi:sporulation protein YlmC with PRC-barrel domain